MAQTRLFPGQGETTVGQVPDGLFCHTLPNAIDCWLREGHLLQPLGERLGYHGCKKEERGVLTL